MIVNCRKCGSKTNHIHCDDDEHFNYIGDNESNNYDDYINNEDFICISNHYDDHDWFICNNCQCYHVACDRCIKNGDLQLCRFIGHDGCFKNNNNEEDVIFKYRVPKYLMGSVDDNYDDNKDPKTHQELNEKSLIRYNEDYPDINHHTYYYVGDYDLFYLNPKEIYPNGPDGGFSNTWKCPKCNYKFSCVDY